MGCKIIFLIWNKLFREKKNLGNKPRINVADAKWGQDGEGHQFLPIIFSLF